MNILLMVTVMLLMLTLMTTAKLETFRSTQILDQFFNHYMEVEERGFINKSAEDEYKTTKMSSAPGKKSTGKKVDAIPRISLYKLADKKLQKEKPAEWNQLVNMLKRLTDTLYADHPFYKEFLEKRPNAIEELATQLTKGIGALETDQKPTKSSDLANISLKDPELDEFFYKMLLGAPYKDVLREPRPTGEEPDNDEDEKTLDDEAKEFSSPQGYYSLLDFVTMKKSDKIRVFLAPKDLLQAIFNDPGVVNDILSERQQYYKAATKMDDQKDIDQLSGSFMTQFQEKRDSSISADMLNFTVNKTNPKEYEKSPSAK